MSNFKELEGRLNYCLDYIPFMKENETTISPKFISIILDSCSLIDSIFREVIIDGGKNYKFKELSELIEPSLNLNNTISIFLNPPISFLNPFKDWLRKTPKWWKAYNKLKHNRLQNYHGSYCYN